jgi:hypothetical protein
MSITIGGLPCTNLTVNDTTNLGLVFCLAPAGPGRGVVQLVVTVEGSGTASTAFAYATPYRPAVAFLVAFLVAFPVAFPAAFPRWLQFATPTRCLSAVGAYVRVWIAGMTRQWCCALDHPRPTPPVP